MKILNVVGARPNFIKICAIIEAIRSRSELNHRLGREDIEQKLVHTGQHYDERMSAMFFDQLNIPKPDVNLEVGSGSHASQTAEIMKRFESVCMTETPTHVLVVGDVNSTIACALVAAKLHIPVVHVEAGLRSFDRRMPEEINRILTDAISDFLFTTEESANANLKREGIQEEKIHFVGNVMIDTLRKHQQKASESTILERLKLADGNKQSQPYGVLTLHRSESVDDADVFREMLAALSGITDEMPIVFPVHPRTRNRIDLFGFRDLLRWDALNLQRVDEMRGGIFVVDPLGYLDFLRLMSCARVVLTDSGGIQEETTMLGIPCVTLRDSTERPITITHGTNVLAGTKKAGILSKTLQQLGRNGKNALGRDLESAFAYPPFWDGKASERIVNVLVEQ
jgi:UDP-N-acetylglucosamine 2-epimerase (non-hydrolysing)